MSVYFKKYSQAVENAVYDLTNKRLRFSYDTSGIVTFLNDSSNNLTQEEISQKTDELYASMPLQDLREKRNQLLTESDWTQFGDVVLADKEEWKTYRQALRDLPSVSVNAAYDVVGNLINVEYPMKPNA